MVFNCIIQVSIVVFPCLTVSKGVGNLRLSTVHLSKYWPTIHIQQHCNNQTLVTLSKPYFSLLLQVSVLINISNISIKLEDYLTNWLKNPKCKYQFLTNYQVIQTWFRHSLFCLSVVKSSRSHNVSPGIQSIITVDWRRPLYKL